MRKALAMIGAIAAIASIGTHTQAAQRHLNNDAVIVVEGQKRPQIVLNKYEGAISGSKHKHWFKPGNQRQYRKWMRQVPEIQKTQQIAYSWF